MSATEPPAPGEGALLDVLHQLLIFLSQDGLTVADVAEHVGRGEHVEPSILGQLELAPRLPGVRAATVSTYRDSGLPYLIRIEPADAVRPTPSALRAIFGEYHQVRTHFGAPRQLSFSTPRDLGPWHVVALAEVEPTDDLDGDPVRQITFRRDPP